MVRFTYKLNEKSLRIGPETIKSSGNVSQSHVSLKAFASVTHGRTETERRSCPRAPHGAHTAHTSDTQGDQNNISLLTSRSGALSVTPSLQYWGCNTPWIYPLRLGYT